MRRGDSPRTAGSLDALLHTQGPTSSSSSSTGSGVAAAHTHTASRVMLVHQLARLCMQCRTSPPVHQQQQASPQAMCALLKHGMAACTCTMGPTGVVSRSSMAFLALCRVPLLRRLPAHPSQQPLQLHTRCRVSHMTGDSAACNRHSVNRLLQGSAAAWLQGQPPTSTQHSTAGLVQGAQQCHLQG